MSDCDHMCAKCDGKPCIEFRPKMAVPRELHTDYEMMVTANLLMAASIESIKRKDEQLKADNAKLRELCKTLYQLADESYVPLKSVNRWMDDFEKAICAMRELGIEVDE